MENSITVEQVGMTSMAKPATFKSRIKKAFASIGAIGSAVMATVMTASASAGVAGFDSVNVTTPTNVSANNLMGNIIGILLTITRFVGIALLIYGVYEIVMSFMQNQPEAKTKGIVMALAGVVMIALKSVLGGLGIGIS